MEYGLHREKIGHWMESRDGKHRAPMPLGELKKGKLLLHDGDYKGAKKSIKKCLKSESQDREVNAIYEALLFWEKSEKAANAAVKLIAVKGFLYQFGEKDEATLLGLLARKGFREKAPETLFGLGRAYLAAAGGMDFDLFAKAAFKRAIPLLDGHMADRYKQAMVLLMLARVDDEKGNLAKAERLLEDLMGE